MLQPESISYILCTVRIVYPCIHPNNRVKARAIGVDSYCSCAAAPEASHRTIVRVYCICLRWYKNNLQDSGVVLSYGTNMSNICIYPLRLA